MLAEKIPNRTITNWHTESRDEILRYLDVEPGDGLSREQVRARQEQYGANELVERGIVSPLTILLEQLKNPLVLLLIFAAVVSVFGRFLIAQQASSTVTDEDLVGRTAQVTVAIKPGTVGQITAKIGDERVERIARAKDGAEISTGSIVKVDAVIGDSVIVVPEETRPY